MIIIYLITRWRINPTLMVSHAGQLHNETLLVVNSWWSGSGGIQAWSWRPTGFLQCFDTVGLVIWPVKIVPEMTYCVSSGTVNHTNSLDSVLPNSGWGNRLPVIKSGLIQLVYYRCVIVCSFFLHRWAKKQRQHKRCTIYHSQNVLYRCGILLEISEWVVLCFVSQ